MLSLPSAVQIYLASEPVDMRRYAESFVTRSRPAVGVAHQEFQRGVRLMLSA